MIREVRLLQPVGEFGDVKPLPLSAGDKDVAIDLLVDRNANFINARAFGFQLKAIDPG